MKNEVILHLDMDGVLSDFDKAFMELSGGVTASEYRKLHGRKGETSLFLKDGGSFFRNLDWIQGGEELLKFALSHFKVVRILTSAGTGKDWARFKEVQAGKIDWITHRAPEIQKKNIIVVPFANLKSRHSGPDRILVDDKDTTIAQWNTKGGVGHLHVSSQWQFTISALRSYTNGPINPTE